MSRSHDTDLEEVGESPRCKEFRSVVIRCVQHKEQHVRAPALENIGKVIGQWTKDYQDQLKIVPKKHEDPIVKKSLEPFINPFVPRIPSEYQHATLYRSGSSKLGLKFEDVFEDDDDDMQASTTNKTNGQSMDGSMSAPLTPEEEPDATEKIETDTRNAVAFKICYRKLNLRAVETAIGRDFRRFVELSADDMLTIDQMRICLENWYLLLLRLTLDCPFKDIRKGCRSVLQTAVTLGAKIPEILAYGPSFLVPRHDTIGMNFTDPPVKLSQQLLEPSDEDEEPVTSGSSTLNSPAAILIPGASRNPRSRSRGRAYNGLSSTRGSKRNISSPDLHHYYDKSTSITTPTVSDHRRMAFHSRLKQVQALSKTKTKARPPTFEIHQFQVSTFISDGRFTNVNKLLSFFPEFADTNIKLTDRLMNDTSSSLSCSWRFYLAIMAAAERKSQYYVSLLSTYFLEVGGHKSWLKGLEHAPKKLQRIARYNALLAHQPWKIAGDDIRQLIRGTSAKNPNQPSNSLDNWTTSEVIMATCILSYHHAQAAFASGCGVVPEVDTIGGTIDSVKASILTNQHSSTTHKGEKTATQAADTKQQTTEPSGISLTSRKRQQDTNTERDELMPDKWLKTPQGSVHSSNPNTAASSRSCSPQNNKSSKVHQRRRKSFEDCVTIEEVRPTPSVATSLSAPTSFVQLSSFSQYPLGRGREFFLSPSSSSASLLETVSRNNADNFPVNMVVEDLSRFIQPTGETGISGVNGAGVHDDFDLNSQEYSFLPMEDFDWERNACEMVGEYVEGLEDILDRYFRQVRKINDNEEEEEEDHRPVSSCSTPNYRCSRTNSFEVDDNNSLDTFFSQEPMHLETNSFQNGRPSFYAQGSYNIDSPTHGFDSNESSYSAGHHLGHLTHGAKSLKEAVWFYSLRLLGIQKDDYPYNDIKVLLPKGTRDYLRRVCRRPEVVNQRDWKTTGLGLKAEDMVLMCLIATQAGFQGELLYGIKAVCTYHEELHT